MPHQLENGNGATPPARSAVSELVQFVRTHSPFYRSLYENLPSHVSNLEDLPLTNNDEYWKASNGETNEVLTTPFIDGLVLRSGGSGNIPKTVLMTRPEFHLTSQINGVLLAETSGLLPGDRVANLSAQGGMYSGFMTFGYTVMNCPTPIVNLPISGSEPLESIAKSIIDFKATVIISNVCISTRLAEHLKSKGISLPDVRMLLFTGEAFYKDLRNLHHVAFPNLRVRPLSYGSVELKIIAFPTNPPDDEEADINPVYRVNFSSVIMEIIDSDGVVIKENGKRGFVYGTNLIMKLQPKLRYPVGDSAEWVDYDAKLFRFRGRETVGLKIGNAHLPCQTIRDVVTDVMGSGNMVQFQTVVRRSDRQNVISLRIASEEPKTSSDIRTRIEEGFMKASPAWRKRRDEGFISPIHLQWVAVKDLSRIESSGKLREIVEERY
ncbi:MAG: hypothetical protein M1822_004531 [Bathelium mastoideum]|nr:MAG: hypothetical protein M1822_004531 [Bathelium mastoideum]